MGMGVGSTVTTLHPSSSSSSSSLAHPALWPSRTRTRTILSIPRSRFSSLSLAVARSAPDSQGTGAPVTAEEEPFSILTALSSQYNDSIMVIDTPSARFLLLDSTRNVHSMIKKDQLWTGSYWDEFASLPAIIPHGPIAMLGLGAGTAAHSILEYYPSFHIIGWELDELLINAARKYFNLSKLEEKNEHGGYLSVCIGDALSPDATVEGGFAGIIVDLFADGKILPELLEEETWVGLAKKLMPNGRIMVNCSGRDDYQYYRDNKIAPPKSKHSWMENSAIKALSRALPAGQVCWKLVEEAECENYFALTGPLPDLDAWSTLVPEKLKKLRITVLVHTYSAIKALSRALPSGQVCWKLVEEAECENYFALTGLLPDLDAWSTLVPAKLCMKVKLWQRV